MEVLFDVFGKEDDIYRFDVDFVYEGDVVVVIDCFYEVLLNVNI